MQSAQILSNDHMNEVYQYFRIIYSCELLTAINYINLEKKLTFLTLKYCPFIFIFKPDFFHKILLWKKSRYLPYNVLCIFVDLFKEKQIQLELTISH